VRAHIAKVTDNSDEVAYCHAAKQAKVPAEIATRCIAPFSSNAYAHSSAFEQFSREEKRSARRKTTVRKRMGPPGHRYELYTGAYALQNMSRSSLFVVRMSLSLKTALQQRDRIAPVDSSGIGGYLSIANLSVETQDCERGMIRFAMTQSTLGKKRGIHSRITLQTYIITVYLREKERKDVIDLINSCQTRSCNDIYWYNLSTRY